jgi:hypothetical protein
MNGSQVGTGGDQSGTGGMRWLATAVVIAVILAKAVLDGNSARALLPDIPAWQAFALELTSASFFVALLLPWWGLVRRLAAWRWSMALAALIGLSAPVALLHVGWLMISRSLVYWLAGSHYRWPELVSQFLFEWPKDLLWLLVLAALGWALDRLLAPPAPPPAQLRDDFRLAVKDGSRTLFLAPDEISHASSAGNYVELATVHGAILHRATLAALADELAPHGFVRIHRAHLVRRGAVQSVASSGNGDFTVTMAAGACLPGSRRYRSGLDQLRQG